MTLLLGMAAALALAACKRERPASAEPPVAAPAADSAGWTVTLQHLRYVPLEPTDSHRVVFETEGRRVERFPAGIVPAVEDVERCG